MKDTQFLIILQYNVQNDKISIMISLLIDINTQNYDVIVFQKFWRNFFASTSSNAYQCEFHLFYRFEDDTRICFYINDKINSKNWKIDFLSTNMCVLTLTICVKKISKIIRLYNVYNLSSISYSFKNNLLTFDDVRRFFVEASTYHHVLLRDFNLHHSFWSDSSKVTQYATINELIDLIDEYELSLILFREIITWKIKNIFNIIDLMFASSYITNRIKHCMFKSNISQSSNHISIFTRIFNETNFNFVRSFKRRVWKLLDMNKLKKIEKNVSHFKNLNNENKIDAYVKDIQNFLQIIINVFVSWTILNRYAKSFWNKKCKQITKIRDVLNVFDSSCMKKQTDQVIWDQKIKSKKLFKRSKD
jgi:hypothetical protein